HCLTPRASATSKVLSSLTYVIKRKAYTLAFQVRIIKKGVNVSLMMSSEEKSTLTVV
ncbi:putative junctophilin, partial [Schistosoma mansoni]|uniref:putative junctophilin n=1 Tax=Schistosoma mansoni TaxID=6183 RepID=UPI00022DC0CC